VQREWDGKTSRRGEKRAKAEEAVCKAEEGMPKESQKGPGEFLKQEFAKGGKEGGSISGASLPTVESFLGGDRRTHRRDGLGFRVSERNSEPEDSKREKEFG